MLLDLGYTDEHALYLICINNSKYCLFQTMNLEHKTGDKKISTAKSVHGSFKNL